MAVFDVDSLVFDHSSYQGEFSVTPAWGRGGVWGMASKSLMVEKVAAAVADQCGCPGKDPSWLPCPVRDCLQTPIHCWSVSRNRRRLKQPA